MFLKRTYRRRIIQDDYHSAKHHTYDQPVDKKKTTFQIVKKKAASYVVMSLGTSSIHGLNHLVASGRHALEVFLWLIMVSLSVFGSVYLSRSSWLRYQSSPTVVSMDRDMLAWNTTFPCVTICPHKRIDERKLEIYLENSPIQDKTALGKFIMSLANSSYKNFEDLPDYDPIPSTDYLQMILNLSTPFRPTLSIGATEVLLSFQPTLTEMGLCYAINSKAALYNSPKYRTANRWDLIGDQNDTFFVHPLDGEVFAQVSNFSTAYDVYLHSPLEVPDIASKFQLSVAQRRCRFLHENPLKHNAVYTYTMCRMECRIRLCLHYCQCIPYFYRRIGDERVCNVTGMHCLARYKDELYKLEVDKGKKKINCGCFPICDDVKYVIQSYVLQEWFQGTNLQWGIVTYPRMRYRRDVLFGFTDVLVAVGSMAGLFLGCSVLSFMEIVYFLTLRLVFYTRDALTT